MLDTKPSVQFVHCTLFKIVHDLHRLCLLHGRILEPMLVIVIELLTEVLQ